MARDRNEIARSAFAQGLRRNGAHVLDKDGKPIESPHTVLISVVSRETVYADFALGLAAMCNYAGAQIALCNNKLEEDSSTPSIALNNSIETAKQLKVGHILFLAPDVAVRPDTLRKLLAHNLPVVGALYPRSMNPFNIKAATIDGSAVVDEAPLQEMAAMTVGCLLVDMKVIELLKRPYFRTIAIEDNPEENRVAGIVPEWVYFSQTIRQAGVQIHADLEVSSEIVHLGTTQYGLQRKDEQAQPDIASVEQPAATSH